MRNTVKNWCVPSPQALPPAVHFPSELPRSFAASVALPRRVPSPSGRAAAAPAAVSHAREASRLAASDGEAENKNTNVRKRDFVYRCSSTRVR